ncbi:hypothetical protein JCM10207_007265 [Rhodosporidiobolus poonsookiae]
MSNSGASKPAAFSSTSSGAVSRTSSAGGKVAAIKRPGFGRVGRPFSVKVNAFAVTAQDLICHQYDVKITSPNTKDLSSTANRRVWKFFLEKENPFSGIAVVYDGRAIAYTPRELPAKQGYWNLNMPNESGGFPKTGQFSVALTWARAVPLDVLAAPLTQAITAQTTEGQVLSATQALNVVIQHGPMMAHPSRGSSFFLPPPKQQRQDALGIEIWPGFFTSLRPGLDSAYINLDCTSQPMYRAANLPGLIVELAKLRTVSVTIQDLVDIPSQERIQLSRLLQRLKVKRTILDPNNKPASRRIVRLTETSAQDSTFPLPDGSTTNVAAYFLNYYRYKLEHPEWPCVVVAEKRNLMWPIELCFVEPGQAFRAALTPTQAAQVHKLTSMKPQDRLAKMERAITDIYPSNDQAFGQWQLRVNRMLLVVEARQLPPPPVFYKDPSRPLFAQNGEWRGAHQQFLDAKAINQMVFVFGSFPQNDVENIVVNLVRAMSGAGMHIENKRPPIFFAPSNLPASSIHAFICETVASSPVPGFSPQLLLCLLPPKSARPPGYYEAIKTVGDVLVGVRTQCLNMLTARSNRSEYFSNVALKINVKLGGTNFCTSLGDKVYEKPTLLFGADLSHAKPDSTAPSVAGVVATLDQRCTKYAHRAAVQPPNLSVIVDLKRLVFELLQQLSQTDMPQPERLIFFRDGVAENQFAEVMTQEVEAVRAACKMIDEHFQPALTYVICGKRHHLRFFPYNPQDADRSGNFKAGMVVDKSVTHPYQFDWYLQSHSSPLGTARTCHYTVLVDDSHFSADELQQLVHNLCSSYQRCTRSVSQVTAAYYAHHLCSRIAALLGIDNAPDSLATSKTLQQYRDELATRPVHAVHNESLFFL